MNRAKRLKMLKALLVANNLLIANMLALISTLSGLHSSVSVHLAGVDRVPDEVKAAVRATRLLREGKPTTVWKVCLADGFENELYPEDDTSWSYSCGITLDSFLCIVDGVKMSINEMAAKSGSKEPRRPMRYSVSAQVAICCLYLKRWPTVATLAEVLKLPYILVWRCIRRTMPHMRGLVSFIIPKLCDARQLQPAGLFSTVGCIDCCAHKRCRIHPGQAQCYRGDKGYHFLLLQLVRDHLGFIIHIAVAYGHNNDLGLYHISEMGDWLQRNGYKLLADGHYKGDAKLVKPSSKTVTELDTPLGRSLANFSRHQRSERAAVEHDFARAHTWAFARMPDSRMTPKFQAASLITVHALNQMDYQPNVLQRAETLDPSKIHHPMRMR